MNGMLPEIEELSLELDLNDERQKNLKLMNEVLMKIPTEAGRKYALSKFLNDKKWGFDNRENFPNVNKDYWSIKNQDDFTPPDIEKAEAKRDAEEFWNPNSNQHWSKRGTQEMKRRATDAGYTTVGAYLNDVRDIQTRKDREKQLEDEFGKAGSYAVKLLYPRMTEKVLQGEDIEGKDFGLDMGEQALYAFNPAERLLGTGAGALAKWGGAVANPLIMETADAIAYNGEDTDRAKFSPVDVGVGTLINRGMGKLTTDKLNLKHRPKLPKEYETAASIANREKFANEWGEKNKVIDDWIAKQEEQAAMGNTKAAENLNYATLEKLVELVKFGTGPEKEMAKTTLKQIARNEAKNLAPNAADFASNKAGDLLSEDPKRTKRLLRSAVGPAGFMATPALNDLLEAYYGSDKKNKEKELINKELETLMK